MPDTIRVLLVDDHAVLRAGLQALLDLESDIEVIGQASSGEEGVEKARELRPTVVVMDLAMPGVGGLEATKQIAALDGKTRVLVLTSHAEEEYLLPVLEAGASGYVRKTSADDDLIEALRVVARDEVFLYPSASKILLRGFKAAEERGEASPLEALSDREREVLTMTAEGYSSSEIGKKLFLSPKTVDTYRARLTQKLGFTHRAELVQFALSTGLLHARAEDDG
ncbi:MAG TPA: response regulator transcription factor [Longimicrobiaceae bacterium]|nr:response regulator transcription factor [Longimicrobiaceae bacterium]